MSDSSSTIQREEQLNAAHRESNSLMPMADRLAQASMIIESNPIEALILLKHLQNDVYTVSLFSPNESLEDISSKSLPLLALDHFLAMATMAQPTGLGQSKQRLANVRQSINLWSTFLQKLEDLELLSPEQKSDLLLLLESDQDGDEKDDSAAPSLPPPISRDAKIARFRAKQQIQSEMARLQSLIQRRQRLQTKDVDEMDGYDQESLERTLAVTALQLHASDALDEWSQALRELPMIEQMIRMEQSRPQQSQQQQHRPPLNTKPLEVTHITQDSATGQLLIRREQVKSQVFRPGWNQPTMTLAELGEQERQEAIEREERQRLQEAERMDQPRRYDELVKAGMEDNPEMVDASAQLDRAWDDWKDANPRGSGNKMGDRGDRNL